jgi:hypothetical protein
MSMTIFLVLNGLGIIFLLYVLANFWKEGHRLGSAENDEDRKLAAEFRRRDWADVVVITHPISVSAQGGLSVIPFQGRVGNGDSTDRGTSNSTEIRQAPMRKFSAR